MPRRVPPSRDQGALASVARAAPKSAIEKSAYMTRDAARRLKLAKKAAKAVLSGGGTLSDAAQAAQAYGTPAEGENSDASDTGDDDELADQVADALQLVKSAAEEEDNDNDEEDQAASTASSSHGSGGAAGSSSGSSRGGGAAGCDGDGGAVMVT